VKLSGEIPWQLICDTLEERGRLDLEN
jgi:hypothetical protein